MTFAPLPEERLAPIRVDVTLLQRLLKLLYDSVSPDIITLEDVLRRYRLTNLGKPALEAIDQSRRITRAIGDYDKIGQCEFHIGLIFLHWGDGRGAVQQFMEARQQWSFDNKTDAVCLAYFATGIAQRHIFEHEKAMRNFGKAKQLLPRVNLSQIVKSSVFVNTLNEVLTTTQEQLREEMWPPALLASHPPTLIEDPAEPSPPITPPPQSRLNSQLDTPTIPIPTPQLLGNEFIWFKNPNRRGAGLPGIQPEDRLLVNKNTAKHTFAPNELIVIGVSNKVEKGMRLTLQVSEEVEKNFYLAYCQFEGKLEGKTAVNILPIGAETIRAVPSAIIGPVIGVYRAL